MTRLARIRAAREKAPRSSWQTRRERNATYADADERSAYAGASADGRKERALVLGTARDVSTYRGCNACHGLPWRRHANGCVGCFQPYAVEQVEHTIREIQSNAGAWSWAAL